MQDGENTAYGKKKITGQIGLFMIKISLEDDILSEILLCINSSYKIVPLCELEIAKDIKVCVCFNIDREVQSIEKLA